MRPSNKNGWRIVALASQVSQKKPLACKTTAQDYVLFRDAKNVVRALEDRCVHRRAPLSLGRITEQGWLQCPYHGWAYEGRQGRCKLIPNFSASERIAANARVQPFAVAEREGFVWLWSDAEKPANKKSISTPSLPALSAVTEGHELICLPQQGFFEALLDNPAIVSDIEGVTLVTGNILGEPVLQHSVLKVEWSAQWNHLAAAKKITPSDYPLVLRVNFEPAKSCATIELLDTDNQLLLCVVIAAVEASDYVTTVHWRWVKMPVKKVKASATRAPYRAVDGLSFAVKTDISAALLLNTHRYVSAIWRQQLSAGKSQTME